MTDERQADERVAWLHATDELGITAVLLLSRADENAFAGPHGLRHREVSRDREALIRRDRALVVTAGSVHVEPFPVLAQRRDQAAPRLGGTHAFAQHRVEHLLRGSRGRERVRRSLEPRRRLERVVATSYRLLCPRARDALAAQHLTGEQRRENEHDRGGDALGVRAAAVVAVREEVEEGIHRSRDGGETRDPTADGSGEDDRRRVQQAGDDRTEAREVEQRDEPGAAERDDGCNEEPPAPA